MKKILSICAAMLMAFAVNAAVINIDTSTEHALRLALNSASSGDVIVMAAGTYNESGDYLAFTGKEVTVRAAEGAEVIIKPVCPVRLKEGAKAEFINVKFDCSVVGSYDYVIVAADDTENKRVVLKGCEFYDWTKNKAMIEATSSRRLAAVTIDSCYFHDCMKSVVFIENTNAINLSITNSTFANISTNTESFWAGVIDSRASSGSVLIDHCTFYNVQAMNTDYAAIGKVLTPGAVVSNCIFMLPTSTDGVRAIRDVSAANNCLTYNYQYDNGTGIHSGVTKNNCIIGQDPLFVDAANGDYTLGAGSPAIGAGSDDSDLGDPRWWPAAPLGNVCAIAGDFTDWATNPLAMTEISANLFMGETSLKKYGAIAFKPIINGAWLDYDANKVSPLTELAISESTDGYHNFTFTLPTGNEYHAVKFYWDATNNQVYVTSDFDFDTNVYSIFGSSSLGLDENQTVDVNNMILNATDSTYSLVKEDISLTAGINYWYKVIGNHNADYDPCYGDPSNTGDYNNMYINVAETGVYDITFSFDWKTKTVSAVAVEQAPFVIADGFYLIGVIDGVAGWNVTDLTAAHMFEANPLAAGEYLLFADLALNDEFKVVSVANNAIAAWYPDGVDNNYVVDADHAGDLKNILFRPEGEDHPLNHDGWHYGKIYVEPNPMSLMLKAGWNTLCLPYDAVIANVDVYAIQSIDNVSGSVALIPENGTLVAGQSFLVDAPTDGFYGATMRGGKVSQPVEMNNFIGNLAAEDAQLAAGDANYDYYILFNEEFHLLAGEATASVAQYKAYIRMTKNPTPAPSLRIVGAATNIENLGKDENAVKFIQNGQLYIKRNGVVYTATGSVVK
jgi:hypothetical protein